MLHLWGEGSLRDNFPNRITPKKKRCKCQALTLIKTWDDSSSEDEAPPRNHGRNHSLSRSSRLSPKCFIARGNTNDSSSSEYDSDSDCKKPSTKELVHVIQFFEEVCIKQKDQLKFVKI
jgi:hypothetical protein